MNLLKAQTIKDRSIFFQKIRSFFLNNNYLEVDTPHLVEYPSLEPYLDPYTIQIAEKRDGVLITSPEFALKKLLSPENPKIFEIAHCYRNDEPGPWHSNEFRMLEWYTIDQELEQLIEQCQGLLKQFFPKLDCEVIEVESWFQSHYQHGFDPEDMKRTLQNQGVKDLDKIDEIEMFFRLFLPTESKLAEKGIVFLKNYPKSQCAYAKQDERIAHRFEIYIKGIEVANAYLEETNPEKLLIQLRKEQEMRKELNKPEFEIDLKFVNALKDIDQPISGIAMGLDRIFAIYQGHSELSQSSPFKNYSALQEG